MDEYIVPYRVDEVVFLPITLRPFELSTVLRDGHFIKGKHAQVIPEMPVLLTGCLQCLRKRPVQLIMLFRVAPRRPYLFLVFKGQQCFWHGNLWALALE